MCISYYTSGAKLQGGLPHTHFLSIFARSMTWYLCYTWENTGGRAALPVSFTFEHTAALVELSQACAWQCSALAAELFRAHLKAFLTSATFHCSEAATLRDTWICFSLVSTTRDLLRTDILRLLQSNILQWCWWLFGDQLLVVFALKVRLSILLHAWSLSRTTC